MQRSLLNAGPFDPHPWSVDDHIQTNVAVCIPPFNMLFSHSCLDNLNQKSFHAPSVTHYKEANDAPCATLTLYLSLHPTSLHQFQAVHYFQL